MATNPLAAVQQYIDAFNKGDREGCRRPSQCQALSLMGWLRICGPDQQPLRIDIEMF